MNDYEHQAYEDTEAQAEAYYDDQWLKNMEYLENYGDAELEGQEYVDQVYEYWESLDEAIEGEEINVLSLDHMARENGEKPAGEWARTDFKDLLHRYPKLRGLKLKELWALFLQYTESIDEVIYCKRMSIEDVRKARARGDGPFTVLATWNLDIPEEEGYKYAFQLDEAEEKKLQRIWQKL